MLKETSYQEKIHMLQPWLTEIVDLIKRDLRSEHLKIDKEFCKKYFLGKNPQLVAPSELALAYEKDIAEGNVGLGEFIATRWLIKNTDIYGLFEEKIKNIDPNFEELSELSLDQANPLLEQSLSQYGPIKTYIFSVFNSVVFPKEIYHRLRQQAEKAAVQETQEKRMHEEILSIEAMQKRHAREIAALTDKFEKKMQGMQKKYLNDVGTLKKQISQLQKKLSESSVNL